MRNTSPMNCYGWLLLALLFCAGAAQGQKPAANGEAPLKLHVIIDSCFCPAFEVKSDGDRSLSYIVTSYSDPEKNYVELSSEVLKPTAAQWKEFRQALDAAKVWQWRKKYESLNVLDGTGWTFEAAYKGREVKSVGSNCYPNADASPGKPAVVTAPFNAVAAAVEKLVGGRAFNSTRNDFLWEGDMYNVLMTPVKDFKLRAAKCGDALDFFRKKGEESIALWNPEHKPGVLKFDLQFDQKKERAPVDYDCDGVSYCTAIKGLLEKYGLEYEVGGPNTLLIKDKK